MPLLPPTDEPLPGVSIRMLFSGLMVLEVGRLRPKSQGRKKHSWLHLLKDLPSSHPLQFELYKWNGASWDKLDDIDPGRNLHLSLRNVTDDTVSFPEDPDGGGPRPDEAGPFRRAFDFEAHYAYDEARNDRVRVDHNHLDSSFRIEGGRYYTQAVSGDELITSVGVNGVKEDFRPLATIIGAKFALDRPESEANFSNGGQSFTFRHGEFYHFNIDQSCVEAGETCDPPGDDAELYFPAIAGNKQPHERIHFHHLHDGTRGAASGKRVPKAGRRVAPHAICFTAVLGGGPEEA